MLPQRQAFDFGSPVYEYRLPGFTGRVNTLAEHLAKLLNRDVAGFPPPDPNPYGDPNRGWCITVKNKITQIRNANYSEAQLARDLDRAGYGGGRWVEITEAIAEVVTTGLCNDHWDDFDGGGPLATA